MCALCKFPHQLDPNSQSWLRMWCTCQHLSDVFHCWSPGNCLLRHGRKGFWSSQRSFGAPGDGVHEDHTTCDWYAILQMYVWLPRNTTALHRGFRWNGKPPLVTRRMHARPPPLLHLVCTKPPTPIIVQVMEPNWNGGQWKWAEEARPGAAGGTAIVPRIGASGEAPQATDCKSGQAREGTATPVLDTRIGTRGGYNSDDITGVGVGGGGGR